MTANVFLLEIEPRNPATGVRQTVRLAGGGEKYPYRYGDDDWQAGLVEAPEIIAALQFDGLDLANGAVPQALAMVWAPATTAKLNALAGLHWGKAPFTLYYGPENKDGTMPPVLLSGNVLDHTVRSGQLTLAMADPAANLKRPVLVDTFAGTGGLEGPAEWEGRPKLRAWGRVFNVEGLAIDPANNVYCFTDPTRPLQDIVDLRDKGVSAAQLDLVPWNTDAATTFADLQASTPAQGGGTIAPSIGCAKWWTRPAGILAADLEGETAGGYVETAAEIAERIVSDRGGPAFVAGTVAAAAVDRPDPAGVLVSQDSRTIAQVLDWLLGGVSIYWVLEAGSGEIRVGTWEFGASQGSFVSDAVSRVAAHAPLQERRIGYRRNHRLHSAADLAAILTYGDGTPIDELQPGNLGLLDQLDLADTSLVAGLLGTGNASSGLVNTNVSIGANGTLAGGGGGQVTIGGLGYTGDLDAQRLSRLGIAGYNFSGLSYAQLRINGVGHVATELSSQAQNPNISIGANGTLAGAGGGQVTIGGLGYLGDLNATFGADASNLSVLIGGHNFLANGDFRTGAGPFYDRAGAGKCTFALDTSVFISGGQSLRVSKIAGQSSTTGGGEQTAWHVNLNGLEALQDREVVVTARFRATDTAEPAFLRVENRKNGSTLFGQGNVFVSEVLDAADEWQTLTAKVAAFDRDGLHLRVGWQDLSAVPDGASIYIDQVQIEVGDVATEFKAYYEPDATLGAIWGTNLTARPANLSSLVGTEGIQNTLLSIGANGALSGGGGGQVTISGLGFTGELNADFTATAQRSIEPQFPSIQVNEGEAGNVGNRTVTHTAKRHTTTLTGGTWSLLSTNLGTGSAAINSSTGTVTLSSIAASGSYTVRYTHTDTVTTDLQVNVTFVAAAGGAVSAKTGRTSSNTGVGGAGWQQVISLVIPSAPAGRVFLNSFGCKLEVITGTGTCSHRARLKVNGVVQLTTAGKSTVSGGIADFAEYGELFNGAYDVAAGNVTVSVEMERTSGTGDITQMDNDLDATVLLG